MSSDYEIHAMGNWGIPCDGRTIPRHVVRNDDKLDALRYAMPIPKQILPAVDCSAMAEYPPFVRKMQEEIREYASTILPFSSDEERRADFCVNGEFLMQVPAWAIPHIHRVATEYLGAPNTYRHRQCLRQDIYKIIAEIRNVHYMSTREAEKLFCIEPELLFKLEVENKMTIPEIKKVIYSGSKTIIIWADDTKTITSCAEGEKFDEYYGFCSAVVKKLFGSTTAAKRALNKVRVENKNKVKKEEVDE